MQQVFRGRFPRSIVVAALVDAFDKMKCDQPYTVGVIFKFRTELLPAGKVRFTVCLLLSLMQVICNNQCRKMSELQMFCYKGNPPNNKPTWLDTLDMPDVTHSVVKSKTEVYI